MLVDPYKAYRALKEVKYHKSVGPDEIPNRILRDFAFELSQWCLTFITVL